MKSLCLSSLFCSISLIALALVVGCGDDNPVTDPNNPPVIASLTASRTTVNLTDTCTIICSASDPDDDALTYNWSPNAGSISGTGSSVIWTSPNTEDTVTVVCGVSDEHGAVVTDSISIVATNQMPTEGLIAHYPFSGSANDESGNAHNGTVFGSTLTADRFGSPNGAYSFDGNDRIDVPDDPGLSLTSDQFTILSWVQFSAFGADGGYYLMGHSEGPGTTKKWIFWLANTSISFIIGPNGGWNSLGSAPFELGTWYHVAIRRNGTELAAFVDGSQIGSKIGVWTMPDPSATFQIGTAEPDRPNRPFKGVIDDIRLYDRALSDREIGTLFIEGQ